MIKYFLFLIIPLLVCCGKYKEPYINIEANFAEVHFERPMSKESLEKLKTELSAIGADIKFLDLKWDGPNLNLLSFELKYRGETGTASTHFAHKINPFGFIIDAKAGHPFRFVVGELAK